MSTEDDSKTEKKPEAAEKDAAPPAAAPPKKLDRVKLWTSLTLILIAFLFVAHVLSDKYVPYSSSARVEAFVIPVSAEVSGRVTSVSVGNNEPVEEGALLLEINPEKYELAVQQAEANLQQSSQTSDADLAAVSTAQAVLIQEEANLANAKVKGDRIIKLAAQGAASQSRADDARTRIKANEAQVERARAELEKARSMLGQTGDDNARIKGALAQLEQAQFDLSLSKVQAPSDGIITNFSINVGNFANVGTPLLTFISIQEVWIEAAMRENALVNVEAGDRVGIVLDAAPGRVFSGTVRNVGYGVSDNSKSQVGGLSSVSTTQGWLRQAQSFPVQIDFDDYTEARGALRVGGQANIIVYTDDRHALLNSGGALWMKLVSLLSHLY